MVIRYSKFILPQTRIEMDDFISYINEQTKNQTDHVKIIKTVFCRLSIQHNKCFQLNSL